MHYKISICIPTYNRAACLQVLLDSIFSQISENTPVEICISDNASTDNTEKLVREYQSKYHSIVYFRSEDNVGFDQNCLRVVSLAHAEYCWLMGDDDRIKEGAVDYILNILSANHGLSGISLNVNFYNKLLTQKKHYTLHFDSSQNKALTSADEILPFLIDHFGFISAQIIKRNLWEEIINNNITRNFYNSYVHLYVITGVVNAHPYWLWVARPCVDRRVTTSDFANGSYQQLETMFTAYYRTISHFFPIHGRIHNKIMESLYKTNIKYSVRSFASIKEKGFTKKAISLLLKYNCWRYLAFWIYTFPWIIMPRKILYLLHYIQKKIIYKTTLEY